MNDQTKFEPELIAYLKEIAEEKKVPTAIAFDALKEALIQGARKYTQIPKRFDVKIDEETGEITVKLRVEVVEDFPDYDDDATPEEVAALDEQYMLLDDAVEFDPDVQVGDVIEIPVPPEKIGRTAVQVVKQILTQKIREAEKYRVLAEYQGKIGNRVNGKVIANERGSLLVLVSNTEMVMPAREQIRKERYNNEDPIQAVISDVSDNPRGAQVVLSRANGQFLIELFKHESPEVGDGVVEIKGVARDPGFRAKIAVISRDDRIDPVGACVGPRGNRVQNVSRELANERIDIIHWTDDLHTYIRRSLSPADIRKMVEVKGTTRIVLVVNDEDLSQAIGRNGQNVRLASQLTGRNLEIIGENDYMAYSEEERQQLAQPRPDDQPLEESASKSREGLDALFAESEVTA